MRAGEEIQRTNVIEFVQGTVPFVNDDAPGWILASKPGPARRTIGVVPAAPASGVQQSVNPPDKSIP
jgi:hypothetical protein